MLTTYPCPFCRSGATLEGGCPGCGREPFPDAAAVVRLDAEIPGLRENAGAARLALTAAEEALRRAWAEREAAAARVRDAVSAAARTRPAGAPAMTAPVTTATSGLVKAYTADASAKVAGYAAEASTRLMQNTLFLLGGLLLAVAAVVFTAVAWSQFGVGGRAGLLGAVTVVALAAPLLAIKRRLTATAETVAAVGLLLVLLDGYAAWYANLFDLGTYSPLGYAGAVFAVSAAVSAGYEQLTGLTGPRFIALVLTQPVLPLLAAPWLPPAALWAYTMIAVALINLAVAHLRPRSRTPLMTTAHVFGGIAVTLAMIAALWGLFLGSFVALSAIALVLAASTVLLAGFFGLPARQLGATLVVVALAIGGARLVWVGFAAPVWAALVPAALAVLIQLTPLTVRPGARRGAILALTPPVLTALSATAFVVVTGGGDWRLPAATALLAAGVFALSRRLSPAALVVPGIAAALGAPGPAVAVTALLTGLALLLFAALRSSAWPLLPGAVLTGAGLVGSAVTDAAVLATVGVVLIAAVVAGVGGRSATARTLGWLAAAAALFYEMTAVGRTTGLDLPTTALLTLGAAVAVLGTGVALSLYDLPEGRLLQGAAHAEAGIALVLAFSAPGHAAAVCTGWALALAIRAVVPGLRGRRWHALAGAASALLGGWILLASHQVSTVEAYTIPLAVVALIAGFLARTERLTSWVTYGPALAAALLPTLATTLVNPDEPLRRLSLGAAALLITVIGTHRHLQAPVLAGGATLTAVALHEAILFWDLLPRWIPLATGGLLLITLATTLERRRRDLTRLRTALSRMT